VIKFCGVPGIANTVVVHKARLVEKTLQKVQELIFFAKIKQLFVVPQFSLTTRKQPPDKTSNALVRMIPAIVTGEYSKYSLTSRLMYLYV
jgi:hypothetical protein